MTTTLVYDATAQNITHLPAGHAAGYMTGSGGVPWTEADFAAHPGAVRIDQSPVNTPLDETADVLDYEVGAATDADLAPWAKAATASFRNGTRAGQRAPVIYVSASRLTTVANTLIAGGVTSGIGLWVASWGIGETAAAAMVSGAAGPFPVIGVQYENNGTYDTSVFSAAWLADVSRPRAAAPPGQWNDPGAWTWAEAVVVGTGLDDRIHTFVLDAATGEWVKRA